MSAQTILQPAASAVRVAYYTRLGYVYCAQCHAKYDIGTERAWCDAADHCDRCGVEYPRCKIF